MSDCFGCYLIHSDQAILIWFLLFCPAYEHSQTKRQLSSVFGTRLWKSVVALRVLSLAQISFVDNWSFIASDRHLTFLSIHDQAQLSGKCLSIGSSACIYPLEKYQALPMLSTCLVEVRPASKVEEDRASNYLSRTLSLVFLRGIDASSTQVTSPRYRVLKWRLYRLACSRTRNGSGPKSCKAVD